LLHGRTQLKIGFPIRRKLFGRPKLHTLRNIHSSEDGNDPSSSTYLFSLAWMAAAAAAVLAAGGHGGGGASTSFIKALDARAAGHAPRSNVRRLIVLVTILPSLSFLFLCPWPITPVNVSRNV